MCDHQKKLHPKTIILLYKECFICIYISFELIGIFAFNSFIMSNYFELLQETKDNTTHNRG